jgi:hypothetical protein
MLTSILRNAKVFAVTPLSSGCHRIVACRRLLGRVELIGKVPSFVDKGRDFFATGPKSDDF